MSCLFEVLVDTRIISLSAQELAGGLVDADVFVQELLWALS